MSTLPVVTAKDYDWARSHGTMMRARAVMAFQGVVDKGGNPYIDHLDEVASHQKSSFERVLALHHDSIEDGRITAEKFREVGAPPSFIARVQMLARPKGVDYFDYVQSLMCCPHLISVKKGDLLSNMNITRLPRLSPEDFKRLVKYHTAYKMLTNAA